MQNKFSIHHYFSVYWLSHTVCFLIQLQYLMTIFSCMFHYLNNLINHTYSVPSTPDNWCCTVSIHQGFQNDPVDWNMLHLPLSFICKYVFTYEEFRTIYTLSVYVRHGSVLISNHMQFFTPWSIVVWLKESVFIAKHVY